MTFVSHNSAEFLALCARAAAGEFAIEAIDRGIVVPDDPGPGGKARTKRVETQAGYTLRCRAPAGVAPEPNPETDLGWLQ